MTLKPFQLHHYGDIEVLTWDLDALSVSEQDLEEWLPEDELRLTRRGRLDEVRRRRAVGRAVVRTTLGSRLGREPKDLLFSLGPYGKPSLPGGPSYNVSHSGSYLALALRPIGRVGVDLEVVQRSGDLEGVARRHFSTEEWEGMRAHPQDTTRAFFRIWVRKEAFIKATGAGLSADLQAFSVSALEAEPGLNTLRRLDLSGEALTDWTVAPIRTPHGTEGALAWDTLP